MSTPPLPLYHRTIDDLAGALQRGEITSRELTRAVIDRIRQKDPVCRAYLSLDEERALEAAQQADQRLARQNATPLTGLPVAIKDNICTTDFPTTCGSRLLESYVSPFDATVVTRLRRAGAVILGKTNLDEFAMGSSTENSAFFPTRNPWDPDRVPGGSSGGSAAAVAYGGCSFALGGDTGGSIRQPAAFCGVVGMKPTYGRVSRWGNVAMASSLDQIGPLTKSVRDCARVLEAIAGVDPRDATSRDKPVPKYLDSIEQPGDRFSIGVCEALLDEGGLDPAVIESFHQAVNAYQKMGASIVKIELPHLRYALPAYYILCPAEVSANLARYDGIRYGRCVEGRNLWDSIRRTRGAGLGAEVKRRILVGAFALSAGYYDAFYQKASQVRAVISSDFLTALQTCDAVLMPATPFPAFEIGERIDDPLRLYRADLFTVAASLAGLPALALPARTAGRLPLGIQLVGRPFDEQTLFQAGRAFERETRWSLADRLSSEGGLP